MDFVKHQALTSVVRGGKNKDHALLHIGIMEEGIFLLALTSLS